MQSTIQGILNCGTADPGAQIVTALEDCNAAVLTEVRQVGLTVTEKRASRHPLAGDLLALATALNPEDPTGKGMARRRFALAELVKTIQRKRAAA